MPGSVPPAPRSRVAAAERRSRLAEAAARRFQRDGYHRVAIADVAADTGVTAPTVYKHFRSKQDLLAGAITSGLDLVGDVLRRTAGRPLDDLVAATAELVLDRPDLWTLLQRERKFLDPARHGQVDHQFGLLVAEYADRLRRERPGLAGADARLLVTAATAALASPSGRSRASARGLVTRELTRSALAILRLDLPGEAAARSTPAGPRATAAPAPPPAPPPADGSYPRRAELLDTAVGLFSRRGYAAVSLDDIGAAVGISGPSIYHHYATKADILIAAFRRASDRLVADYAGPAAGGPDRSLGRLVGVYVDFCLRNRLLVGVYVSEAVNLPAREQRRISAVLRDLVAGWADALVSQDERVDRQSALIRAGSALTVVDDVIRLGPFHERPLIADETRAIALAALLGVRPAPP